MDQSQESSLSRREFHRLLALAGMGGATVSILGAVPRAGAQANQPTRIQPRPGSTPPSGPAAPGPISLVDAALKRGRTRDWTLKVAVDLTSYQQTGLHGGQPNTATIIPFKFTAAAILFPVLATTAASETAVKSVAARLRFDQREQAVVPGFIDGLHSGARFARWDVGAFEGRDITIELDIPMTCWELTLDERAASIAKWAPGGKWPAAALSTFGPQMGVQNGPVVTELVSQWCERKPPTDVPPLTLAKYLAGETLEHVQPSGDGLTSARTGLLQGFELRGSELTLSEGKGSEHDISCALAAVYRAAGLPCRTVIGLDVTESKGQDRGLGGRSSAEKIRSWVELCLCDEKAEKETWIPVDIMRQRKSSSKAPAYAQPWKWFGNNEDTDDLLPIAFQYHPPAHVIAHGSPAFWGWTTTPSTQVAEQAVRLTALTTPIRPERPGDRPTK